VRVGVDGEQAAGLDGQAQQPPGRVAAFRTAVDLDRDAVITAGCEHRLGIEGRLGPAPATFGPAAPGQQPAGAVPEHIHVRAGHRGHHPVGHRLGGHPQAGMRARDDHVELAEQVLTLIQRAILEYVHLDAGQDPERSQFGIELGDEFQLLL